MLPRFSNLISAALLATLLPGMNATPTPTVHARAACTSTCTFPTPPKTSTLSAPRTVTGTFDGGNVRFDRGSGACSDGEGGDADAVFILQAGATLSNVVIGANQMEGVHCLGSCNLINVWFEDVCEKAITVKQASGTTSIQGGGYKGAEDTVIQHNGGGTVNIAGICVMDFGVLYRSCGNCSTQYKRTANIKGITAINGNSIAKVNSNYGDTVTITGTNYFCNVDSMCDTYQGVLIGTPIPLTTNVPNTSCKY